MRMLLIAPILLALGASAQSGEPRLSLAERETARLAKLLEGKSAGKPRSCLATRDYDGVESFGESTLIFRVSRGLVYRNDASGDCRRIGRDRAMITRVVGNQLCRGDVARAADLVTGVDHGFCILGDFTPYRS